jgi:MFS family permease
VSRIVERLVPERLGTEFRWLLGSSWVAYLGDGFALAAGPLLIASQTHNPTLVGLATLLQRLPWLVFGLYAGALADRTNRKRMVITVDVIRAAVLVVLSVLIVSGVINVALVLCALFVLGITEVFGSHASTTILPMLVARSDLALANARFQTGLVTVNQLIGPPVGAALFAVSMSLPFAAQALLVSLGVALVTQVRLPAFSRGAESAADLRTDIAEGLRWVAHHAAVRTLALTILIFNVTFGAAWSVLVLYANERLGLGAVGFGLLTTVSALGGIVGTTSYGWITRRVSLGDVMRIGLIFETFTHLALALTTTPAVAMVIFFVFGAHAFIWGTTSITVRQRAVPTELQGRVTGVNSLAVFGGLVLGSAIGGPIASAWGITAPFWFAFVGSAIFVVLIWRQLAHIAHEDERETEPASVEV